MSRKSKRQTMHPALNKTRKWVIFRLSSLGDVVLTTGVIDFLSRECGLEMSVITREGLAPVFYGHPGIKRVQAMDPAEMGKNTWKKQCTELVDRFSEHGLLDLHGTLRSGLLKLMWPGPCLCYPKMNLKRRLFRYLRDPVSRRSLLATNIPQRYFAAVGPPPEKEKLRPRIFLKENELEDARQRLEKTGINRTFVCIHPYATHPAKNWPQENWLNFLARLEEKHIDWIVLGRDKNPLLTNHPRDLTNKTGLRETCALIALSGHLITPDSGPMHLGTGVETPVTALFGPTSREWGFYPSGENDRIVHLGLSCSPCTLHGRVGCRRDLACMRDIAPETVLRTVLDRLKGI